MKVIKLTPVQSYKLEQARDQAASVLRDVKAMRLEGKMIETMKILERAVIDLESFRFATSK